ncbi:MAG: type II and III secretion system protein family protein [Granulosicoccus sp.]
MDKCKSKGAWRCRFTIRTVWWRHAIAFALGFFFFNATIADEKNWQAIKAPVDLYDQPLQPLPLSEVIDHSSTPVTINLDLFVGEVKVLNNIDVKRVAVGNGNIVRAEVIDTGQLLIIAASAGSSSVRLWNNDGSQSDYNIRVSATDQQTRVLMQRTVRMRVRMVEFRKNALGRLGIDWSDSTTGPGLAMVGDAISNDLFRPAVESFNGLPTNVAPFSTYFGIASNITSRINFLAQNGDAVTLAEPVLSAMNGGEASFLAGGEVPYPSIGENGQTQVEFKEYGVKLSVAPLIDSAGNVRARVETEISQLDSSVSVQGTPGLLTRRAQTEVTVRSGETIVVSGLLSSESSADTDLLPGLGRLPVIGRLFRSRGQRNAVSELVIFITPEVIEPGLPVINARERDYLKESDKRFDTVRQQLPLME